MLIISVKYNENKRWKRKTKSKDKENKEVVQATVKLWELNNILVHLS